MMMYINGLSKEERKEIKDKFLESEASAIYKKANRVWTIGIVGVIFAIMATVYDILYKTGIWSYSLDGILFVFSAVFIYKTNILKNKELNNYALNEKKDTKSKKK